MGKRLNQSDLLAEIKVERSMLTALLESLPKREITKRNRNEDGWAIKDILTHLIDWESRGNQWYVSGKQGLEIHLPAEGFRWSEVRALNEQIFRTNRRRALEDVLEEFEVVHKTTLRLINQMSDRELTQLNYYSWTGKSWTVSDYIRANTASHYRWATAKIRKWLKPRQYHD